MSNNQKAVKTNPSVSKNVIQFALLRDGRNLRIIGNWVRFSGGTIRLAAVDLSALLVGYQKNILVIAFHQVFLPGVFL
jgi:hypothetical protein